MKPTYEELLTELDKMTSRFHRAILSTGTVEWAADAATETARDMIERARHGDGVKSPSRDVSHTNQPSINSSLNQERDKKIIEAYQSGKSGYSLAHDYGVTSSRVYQILKNVNKQGKHKNKSDGPTPKQMRIIECREQGMTYHRISNKINVASNSYIYAALKKYRPDLLGNSPKITLPREDRADTINPGPSRNSTPAS